MNRKNEFCFRQRSKDTQGFVENTFASAESASLHVMHQDWSPDDERLVCIE